MPDGHSPAAGTAWSLYVLRCADGSLYTGIAIDVRRRLADHEHGTRGAKYLRGRGPYRLELAAVVGDRGEASRAERRVKRLPKHRKEALLRNPDMLVDLIEA